MTDSAFLRWIHQRLHQVHGEPLNVDYMIRLRNIIAATRTQAEVIAAQATVIGCCSRHADNQGCDCLKNAKKVKR